MDNKLLYIPIVTIAWPSLEDMYPQLIIGQVAIFPKVATQKFIIYDEFGENLNNQPKAAWVTMYDRADLDRWKKSSGEYDWMTFDKVKQKYDKGPNRTFREISDVMFPQCNVCGYYKPNGCRECNPIIARRMSDWD